MLTTTLSPSHRWSGPKEGKSYIMRCVETSKYPNTSILWCLYTSGSNCPFPFPERGRREQSKQVTFLPIKDKEVSDDRDKLRKRPLMKK